MATKTAPDLDDILKAANIAADSFRAAMNKRGLKDSDIIATLGRVTEDVSANNAVTILGLRALHLSEKANPLRTVRALEHIGKATDESAEGIKGALSRIVSAGISGNAGIRATKHYTGAGVTKAAKTAGGFGLRSLKFGQTKNAGLFGMRWPTIGVKKRAELGDAAIPAAQNLLGNIARGKTPDHLAELIGADTETLAELTSALRNAAEREGENINDILKAVGDKSPLGEALGEHFAKADAARSGKMAEAAQSAANAMQVAFVNNPKVNIGAAVVSAALAVWVAAKMNTRQSGEPQLDENGKEMDRPRSRWKQAAKFVSVSALLGTSAVATGRAAMMPNASGTSWAERMTSSKASPGVGIGSYSHLT